MLADVLTIRLHTLFGSILKTLSVFEASKKLILGSIKELLLLKAQSLLLRQVDYYYQEPT